MECRVERVESGVSRVERKVEWKVVEWRVESWRIDWIVESRMWSQLPRQTVSCKASQSPCSVRMLGQSSAGCLLAQRMPPRSQSRDSLHSAYCLIPTPSGRGPPPGSLLL